MKSCASLSSEANFVKEINVNGLKHEARTQILVLTVTIFIKVIVFLHQQSLFKDNCSFKKCFDAYQNLMCEVCCLCTTSVTELNYRSKA